MSPDPPEWGSSPSWGPEVHPVGLNERRLSQHIWKRRVSQAWSFFGGKGSVPGEGASLSVRGL